jgi:hypothetical protein
MSDGRENSVCAYARGKRGAASQLAAARSAGLQAAEKIQSMRAKTAGAEIPRMNKQAAWDAANAKHRTSIETNDVIRRLARGTVRRRRHRSQYWSAVSSTCLSLPRRRAPSGFPWG